METRRHAQSLERGNFARLVLQQSIEAEEMGQRLGLAQDLTLKEFISVFRRQEATRSFCQVPDTRPALYQDHTGYCGL